MHLTVSWWKAKNIPGHRASVISSRVDDAAVSRGSFVEHTFAAEKINLVQAIAHQNKGSTYESSMPNLRLGWML